MKDNELYDFLVSEAEHPFSGWDFSYINSRFVEFPLTWSYFSKVLQLKRMSASLLDLGTGGGEFLASLAPLPNHTCATEGYEPNFSTAKQKLEALGVKVVFCKNESLPFDDEEFELVIDRHAFYNPNEVYRVLKQNGIFITQQVGEKNIQNLKLVLTGIQKSQNEGEWNLEFKKNELESAGFEILEGKEDFTQLRIFDVGALVYWLKAIIFEFPDFTIEKYYDKLVEINDHIKENGYLDLPKNNHRYLIKAQKSKN
ncbi:hypothetical protein LCGC14_1846700 [marine sediment metagenome]|uniref:Methyltransferase type 11 domain-containing protein n=1 Tax=marine sediment metagenome TaxID=412755 RepID=A0A0F9GBW1_9ZZZZ